MEVHKTAFRDPERNVFTVNPKEPCEKYAKRGGNNHSFYFALRILTMVLLLGDLVKQLLVAYRCVIITGAARIGAYRLLKFFGCLL